jgi:hypothetical protein
MLLVFTKFACLLQGMGRDFEDMCVKSQPQTCRLFFFDSTKLKNMPEKDDTWHGAMV